jgi:hypothetical protein
MEILEFRNIRESDPSNFNRYGHWSRYYEYPTVNFLLEKYLQNGATIHNTSWGWEPPNHTDFKEDLELKWGVKNVVNSDIHLANDVSNICICDITQPPIDIWKEHFDCVINVSALEEINFNHFEIFKNLLEQTKKGGYVIITFDLPGFQLDLFEKELGRTMDVYDDAISGVVHGLNLKVGLLVVRK